ncbi:hypothetical protein BOTBODRAFT_75173, partial [Botryobasidium botryosum FD-172 SS1]
INPTSFTPSKRIRLMCSALEKTSGSFLVSESPLLSAEMIDAPVLEGPPPLPAPDWSLIESNPARQSCADLKIRNKELTESLRRAKEQLAARELILEGVHAQLVVQNLYLVK